MKKSGKKPRKRETKTWKEERTRAAVNSQYRRERLWWRWPAVRRRAEIPWSTGSETRSREPAAVMSFVT